MEVIKGRMYDYNNGRFLSVDPFIQSPTSTQSMNPYTYIFNNPLSGVDPTGYFSLTGLTGFPGDDDPYNPYQKFGDQCAKFCVSTDGGKNNDDGSDEQKNKGKDIVDLGTVVVTGSVITAEGFFSRGGSSAAGSGLFSEAGIYGLKGASAIIGIFLPTTAGDSTYQGGYYTEEELNEIDNKIQNSRGMENVGTPNPNTPPPNGDDENEDELAAFYGNGNTSAKKLMKFAENKGWTRSQTANGPIKYTDKNGVIRLTIKRGSSRAPGSGNPHIEVRNSKGQRIDPATGKNTTRKDPVGNHRPIDYDL